MLDISSHASALQLRGYQQDILHKLPHGPSSRALVQLPTGAGKTAIAVMWSRLRGPTPARPLWFIVHRRELFDQTIKAFEKGGQDVGAIAAGEQETPGAAIQICMVQTLALRDKKAARARPAYICVDEAHHAPSATWAAILRDNPQAEILGLTATPCRQDRKPLGKFFKTLICGPSTRELIDQGWLSEFVYFHGVEPDLSHVTMLAGDYDPVALGASAEAALLIAEPWNQWKREGLRGPSLLFAPNVESSKRAAQFFSKHGVRAAHVDYETPDRERAMILEGWQNRQGVELICNVALFWALVKFAMLIYGGL